MRRLDALDRKKRQEDAEWLEAEAHLALQGPRGAAAGATSGTCPATRCCPTSATRSSRSSRASAARTSPSRSPCRTPCSSSPSRRCWSRRWASSTRSTPRSSASGPRSGQTFHDTQGDLYEYLLSRDRHRRQERPVPHAAPHHPDDVRPGGPASWATRSATPPAAPAASCSAPTSTS